MRVPQVMPVESLALVALAAISFMVLVLVLVPASDGPAVGPSGVGAGRRRVRRACRAFADAVALGDLDRADAMATRALRPARGFLGRGPSPDPVPAMIEWDERKVFAVSIDDLRRQFLDPSASAFWFPGFERVAHDGRVDVLLGAGEPIRLALVSEAWTPELDGMSFTAGCAAFQLNGYLTFRTVIAGTEQTGGMRTALEVWVHMETTDSPDGRRALARARSIVSDGLGRMAAELNPI